jgi:hypothetical protein
MDYEAWEDEDELKITQENDSPGVAGRKPWVKKGAKRSKRRVISTPPRMEKANYSASRAENGNPP